VFLKITTIRDFYTNIDMLIYYFFVLKDNNSF